MLLSRLTPEMLERFYGELLVNGRVKGRANKGLSRTTVHSVHVAIGRALADALRWRKVSRNVAAEAKAPTPTKAERPVWSAEQLRRFLVSVADDRLRVASTRVVVGYKVVEGSPKTAKSARTIGLDAATVAVLRVHKSRQAAELLSWGPGRTESGLLFTREDGAGLHPERITRLFETRVNRTRLPRITVHGLRHSYATAGLEAGVALKVISERLGHSSISITGDLYSHVLEHVDQAAADTVASFIFGTARPS